MEQPEIPCDDFDASMMALDSYTLSFTADTTAFPSTTTYSSSSTSTSRTFNTSAVLHDISEILILRHLTFGFQDQPRLPGPPFVP